jgi:hypothetical protein
LLLLRREGALSQLLALLLLPLLLSGWGSNL